MSDGQFKAWAGFEPKGKLSEWAYTPRPLGPRDVEIDITHCGMCATGNLTILRIYLNIK